MKEVSSLDILAGHMIGDYVFQTNEEAISKTSDKKALLSHVTKYTLAFIPVTLVSKANWYRKSIFIALLFGSHLLTDSRRWASGEKWKPKPILVDQALHAVQLTILKRLL